MQSSLQNAGFQVKLISNTNYQSLFDGIAGTLSSEGSFAGTLFSTGPTLDELVAGRGLERDQHLVGAQRQLVGLRELGVELADINATDVDTHVSPYDYGAQGSRTAFSVGNGPARVGVTLLYIKGLSVGPVGS